MQEFFITGVFEVDRVTGKKKLVDIRFPTETIRQLTDKEFIKRKK